MKPPIPTSILNSSFQSIPLVCTICGKLKNLDELNLGHPILFDFGEEDVVAVTSNWSKLSVLRLEDGLLIEVGSRAFRFSLGILRDLLKNMPLLRELCVYWKTEVPEDIPVTQGTAQPCLLTMFDPLSSFQNVGDGRNRKHHQLCFPYSTARRGD